ncbi:MAG: bifunctional diaminohydroxyphosphoribosylaminopyrimidine deaminase/5-amino-6-(5-phosphoribosylamino)uracil reductase RibD [Dehalococcoidia bacterium]|nr:bifunctional diaminohydroxyphosphoribosylaminopyrimidine deaminase/5-amino-6-(5-phosphoribosylamino)uracil reductase RibD [Dehalococcoidia bacterium]
MRGALTLAKLALGSTSPNPAVGAIIVKHGLVVGMGHTQPPGSWHAEVMALQQAGPKAYGATMYVTLEPCCHYGRTPPCTEAIVGAGIEEVHVATLDPNPVVAGKGVSALEKAGIKVVMGDLGAEAREVNEAYLKYVTTGMPFVTVKLAMSVDGKIATRTGDSKWISGEESRKWAHNLRHVVDAIMVGVNTVITDDPHLTARSSSGKGGKAKKQPLRIIVDGSGSTPVTAQVFKEPGNTLMAVAKPIDPGKVEAYRGLGAEVLELPQQSEGVRLVDVEQLLKEMGRRQVTHVLVEGGGKLIGSLFDANLVDKYIVFIAPIVVGGEGAAPAVGGKGIDKVSQALILDRMTVRRFGEDIMISGYPQRKKEAGEGARAA